MFTQQNVNAVGFPWFYISVLSGNTVNAKFYDVTGFGLIMAGNWQCQTEK